MKVGFVACTCGGSPSSSPLARPIVLDPGGPPPRPQAPHAHRHPIREVHAVEAHTRTTHSSPQGNHAHHAPQARKAPVLQKPQTPSSSRNPPSYLSARLQLGVLCSLSQTSPNQAGKTPTPTRPPRIPSLAFVCNPPPLRRSDLIWSGTQARKALAPARPTIPVLGRSRRGTDAHKAYPTLRRAKPPPRPSAALPLLRPKLTMHRRPQRTCFPLPSRVTPSIPALDL
ncbi:hypothetical protein C8R43DRAFT_998468 [Mycena crocata]|nr:hypothetical protein C8R43DRAFT_998468 [Mycena crocata]